MQSTETQLRDRRTAMIREAVPDDAVRLLHYLDEVTGETDFLAMGPGELNWPEEKERQFIEDHHRADNKLLLVAEIEGQIAGILGYTGDDRPRLRHTGEFGITISRAFWGLGLGTALMQRMIAWARTSGIVRKIGMRVRTDNERALSLYDRFGFVREGVVTRQFAVAGRFHDAYLMGLEIDP
ncbi:MAG: GNAT family N-acetyltransferase [Phycisphaerales bacterium]|nr:MAG: GNAT family N-acetyltransferase [Phycisphaerales bacterium]